MRKVKLFLILLACLGLSTKASSQGALIPVPIYYLNLNTVGLAANGLGLQGYILDHVEDEAGYYADGTEKVILWVYQDCVGLTGLPKPYPSATCYQGANGTWGWR
jgi:hypothetical protein